MKIAVLAADGFQDSEYFLPKIAIEKLGVETEVISLAREPIRFRIDAYGGKNWGRSAAPRPPFLAVAPRRLGSHEIGK